METSFWQRENAGATFDPYGEALRRRERERSAAPIAPAAEVPAAQGAYYDPQHPDADWTGLVGAGSRRKRAPPSTAATRTNFSHAEGGIVPRADAEEVPLSSRRSQRPRPGRAGAGAAGGGMGEAPLIGSAGGDDPDHWVTSNMAQMRRQPVNREDQYTDKRRILGGSGARRRLRPQHELQAEAARAGGAARGAARGAAHGAAPGGPLPRYGAGARSLIGGLGAEVYKSAGIREVARDRDLARRELGRVARSRDLIEVNHTGQVPGYTGRLRR